MNTRIQADLDYVAAAVRRQESCVGVPSIYALWSVLILVGFALPDFAPQAAGIYWLIAGIGGGLLSWWMADRDERRHGVIDRALGRRFGLHWIIGGVAYLLTALPMFLHGASSESAAGFLFTTGILYALAGVHMVRPLLWCGLLALAGYAVLLLFPVPHVWTVTGVLMAACLALAGLFAVRARAAGTAQ